MATATAPAPFRPERMDADEMLAEEDQYVVTAKGLRQLTKTAVEGRAT